MSWQVPGYVHRHDLGGGMTGQVVLAANESTGELVAVKYLRVEEGHFDQLGDEMRRLSTLDATYFVRIREYVQGPEGAAIVMDAVNGASLRLLLRDHGALSPEASILLFRDSLAGLVGAHAADIVHGDYRPENVIVDTAGASRMLDVTMATWIRRDITLGTGVYLAPERWRAETLTAPADVYATTITFVEMLAGEPPYWEESQLLALRYMHEQDDIPVAGIPLALQEIVLLGLAKDVEARADAATLLSMSELAASRAYGAGWDLTGRRHLAERVALVNLPIGGQSEIVAAGAFVAVGERDESDDYYADGAVVAAAGVVGLAALGGMAAADALAVAGTEEDVLTADEELAVAEIEEIIVASDAGHAGVGEGVLVGAVVGGVLAEGAAGGGAMAAGGIAVETEEITMATRPAVPVGVGVGAAEGAAIGYAAEEVSASFIRRHPWLTGLFTIILVILCAGAALFATGGLAGGPPSSTPVAAISSTPTTVGEVPVGSPSPSVPSSPTGSPIPSTSCPASPSQSTSPSTSPSESPSPSKSPSHSPSPSPSTSPTKTHSPSPSPTNPYIVGAGGQGAAGLQPAVGKQLPSSPPGPPC